jgi:hypothetical protein
MDRRPDLIVAAGAAAATLAVVAAGELLGGVGGPLLRALPLSVFFAFTVVHDSERGGLDRPRYWVALAGAVAAGAMAWLAL